MLHQVRSNRWDNEWKGDICSSHRCANRPGDRSRDLTAGGQGATAVPVKAPLWQVLSKTQGSTSLNLYKFCNIMLLPPPHPQHTRGTCACTHMHTQKNCVLWKLLKKDPFMELNYLNSRKIFSNNLIFSGTDNKHWLWISVRRQIKVTIPECLTYIRVTWSWVNSATKVVLT